MKLREDVFGPIAGDGTTLCAGISVQDQWPKNVQAGQKIGEEWKKTIKMLRTFSSAL